jgi:hypothetical protein
MDSVSYHKAAPPDALNHNNIDTDSNTRFALVSKRLLEAVDNASQNFALIQ